VNGEVPETEMEKVARPPGVVDWSPGSTVTFTPTQAVVTVRVAAAELSVDELQLVTLHLNWLPSIEAVTPVTVRIDPELPEVQVVVPLLVRSLHDPDELFRFCHW
jgi:hypothetical protein